MIVQKEQKDMDLQSKKLSLIERLMKIREAAVLQRFEELLIQTEMDDRAEESLKAIKDGNVTSYDDFKNEAREWIKNKKSIA